MVYAEDMGTTYHESARQLFSEGVTNLLLDFITGQRLGEKHAPYHDDTKAPGSVASTRLPWQGICASGL